MDVKTFEVTAARALIGATLRIEMASEPPLDLRVTGVTEFSDEHAHVRKRAFKMTLVGDRLVPQAIYPFRHETFGEEPVDLFIVPVGRTPEGYEYEMIFT